jgi:hypothetical protein
VPVSEDAPPAAAAKTPVIVLRVVVNAPDLDAFITRYSKHLAGDRIFIFTKTPQPIGTRCKFSLHLKNGEPLIHGKGTVVRVQAAGDPKHPPGMELVFETLDERSQTLVDFMHATRLGAVEAMAPAAQAVIPPKPEQSRTALPEPLPPLPPLSPLGPAPLAPPPIPADATSPPVASSEVVEHSAAEPPSAQRLNTPGEALARAAMPKAPEPEVAPWLASRGPKAKQTPFAREDAEQRRAATAALLRDASKPPSYLGPADPEPEPAEARTAVAPLPAPALAPAPASETNGAVSEWAKSAEEKSEVGVKLAEALAPFAQPESVPAATGPAPVVAEAWREPIAPGAPAVAPEGVPANPFSDVTDNAIDYFVEWSLEQSIGPRGERSEPSSKFSNISMSLPAVKDEDVPKPAPYTDDGHQPLAPRSARPAWMLLAAGAAGGLPLGMLLMWAFSSKTPAPAPPPAVAPIAAPVAPAAKPEPEPAAEPDEETADPKGGSALTVATRPPGASITVDGKQLGTSPATLSLSPGAHEVTITKDRYATVTQNVKVPGNVDIDLRRPSLALQVTSMPTGAAVTVAGLPKGKTPLTIKLPGYEKYDVHVSLPNTDTWRKAVYLKTPTTAVNAVLVLKKSTTVGKKR